METGRGDDAIPAPGDIATNGLNVPVGPAIVAWGRYPFLAAAHAQRQILPLNVAGRNVLVCVARYYFLAYSYYGGGRVPALHSFTRWV